MTLVLMATHPWGTLWDSSGNVQSGEQASFTNIDDATAVTHYADAAYASPSTGPVTADANGRLMRWVEEDSYNMELPDATVLQVEATSGRSVIGKADKANLSVNVGDYNPVPDLTDATSKAANVTAFNAAIAAANTDGRLIEIPTGYYFFTTGATLTTLTTARGFVASGVAGGVAELRFNTDGDCIKLKGFNKLIRDLYVSNVATTHSAKDAVIRVQNCAGGDFRNVQTASEGANSRGFLLEQVYDGSAEDAYLLVHVGTWYNSFQNIVCQYVTFGTQAGYGLAFEVDSSAVSVVNPTGQAAGTYSGSVSHNSLMGLCVEGKDRGLNLDRASNNTFIGGQFLGCNTQVYGRNAASNTFQGIRHNQWVTRPYDLEVATCYSNAILCPTLTNGGGNFSLGIVGAQTTILASAETVTESGLTPNGPVRATDGTAALPSVTFAADNDTGLYRTNNNEFRLVAGGALVLAISSTPAFYAPLEVWNVAGSNKALSVDTQSSGHVRVHNGLGVGNSASATEVIGKAVVKKIQIFDAAGSSLGYIPVYSSIT